MPWRLYRRPILANYYLTYRCNAACSFCNIWQKPSPYADVPTVLENLRALRRLGVRIIDFTGGEPLLHRALPLFLEAAQRLGFLTTVTTNGLLYPKRAQELRGKIDLLHFSLDAASPAVHNTLRGGVPCFEFIQESLKIAQRLGEKPDILFTVSDKNWQDIEEVYARFVRPYGLILILNPIFAYSEVGTNSLSPEVVAFLRQWARKKADVYLNEAFLRLRAAGGNSAYRPICRASSVAVVISPDNQLLLPCYHAQERGYAFPINGQLEKLYYSPPVRHLRALEGRFSFCQGCAINCYMEPSFAVELSPYFWASLPSTLRYLRRKWGLSGVLRLWWRVTFPTGWPSADKLEALTQVNPPHLGVLR